MELGKIYFFFSIINHIAPMSIKNISDSLALSNRINDLGQSFASTLRKVNRVSSYGEKCNTQFDCALQTGLTCINSTCLCSSPEYIARLGPNRYSDTKKIADCVLRAGSECKVGISFRESKLPGVVQKSFPTDLWTTLIKRIPFLNEVGDDEPIIKAGDGKCVDNAVCMEGICECLSDYYKDSRGICYKKGSFSQECKSPNGCLNNLECVEGICICRKDLVYDDQDGKCLTPVGGLCDAYSSSNDLISACVKNAECSNDRCTCLEGYIPSSDGSCGISHGNTCSSDNKCSDIQLTCRSGRCQCRYPIHQTFNETSGVCVSKPDGPCTPTQETSRLHDPTVPMKLNCVPFAECLKVDALEESVFEYSCKCIQNYDENQVGECIPTYLSSCIQDEDCDQVGQLTCLDNQCKCSDELLSWDRLKRKCVGLVGARCKTLQLERLLSMRVDVPTDCLENGVCIENVPVLDGRCECKTGFYFNKELMKCDKF